MSDTTTETNIFNSSGIKIQVSKIISDFHQTGYGTSPNVLTGGSTFTYASDGSAGALTLLASVTATASATVNFSNYLSSNYDNYLVVMHSVASGDATDILMRVGTGTTPTYETTSYAGVIDRLTNGAIAAAAHATTSYTLATSTTITPETGSGELTLLNTQNSSNWKIFLSSFFYRRSAGAYTYALCGGRRANATVLTSVQFLSSSGNIAGTFKLYGYKN